MVEVKINDESFAYDIHSLIQAFYGGEEVQVRVKEAFTETVPVCKNMKKVLLEKVLHVLKTGENEVHVTDETREKAKKPLERMLELAK